MKRKSIIADCLGIRLSCNIAGNEARFDLPREGPALVRLSAEGIFKEERF